MMVCRLFVVTALLYFVGCAGPAHTPRILSTFNLPYTAAEQFPRQRASPKIEQDPWIVLAALDWPPPQSAFSGYDYSIKEALWSIYGDGGVELYCRTSFTTEDASNRGHEGQSLSWEHVAPASILASVMGFEDRDCQNAAETPRPELCLSAISDMHNLLPAFSRINSSRADSAFAELPGEGTNNDSFAAFCGDYERTYDQKPSFVEPTIAARGDIARALIYMHFVYGLPLDHVVQDRELLLVWMRQDPVDAEEQRIAKKKESVQGTSNPLISEAVSSF